MEEEKNVNSNSLKSHVLAYVAVFVFVAVVIVGVTYAIFNFSQPGTKKNEVVTGTLVLTLQDGAGINLSDAIPVTDAQGLASTPYSFTVNNTGTLNSKYQIKIINDTALIATDGCSGNQLSWNDVKYSLTKNNAKGTATILGTVSNGIVDTGTLAAGGTNSYELRLWIDQNVTSVSGEHLHVKVQVDGIAEGHTDFNTGA